jgi:hypothetical protein
MPCERVSMPKGGVAIVCSAKRRCACGTKATLLCDWKVPTKASGTCDRPICAGCASELAPEKHLCPEHTRSWKSWRALKSPEGARR